jgi:hypothetical protein
MKKFLLLSALAFTSAVGAQAQITITAADMPVIGDSLRYSFINPLGATVDLTTTGANATWNFSALVPVAQGLDEYKSAAQVNITYAATISPLAYGYKVADSIPGGGALPVTVKDIYTFFSKKPAATPNRYVAEAFAAKISGIPTPINYSNEDEIYFFPLNYTDVDTSSFRLAYSFSGLGSFSQTGTRHTTVDGWGTITTPHFTTPINALRVVSEVVEIDSFTFGSTSQAIPRHYKEYKWLANGEHYPVLWVTTNIVGTNESISSVRFRDHYRYALGIENVSASVQELTAYPNPATADLVTITIPKGFMHYTVGVFDVQGKLVTSTANNANINVASLSKGQYLVRVISGENVGYVRIVR